MTGVVGVTAGSEFVRTAKADHEVEFSQTLFDQTVSVPRTDIEVEHIVTLTVFEGHCEQSEYRHLFNININTIAYEEGIPATRRMKRCSPR